MLLQVLFWDAVWGAVGGASDGAGARLTAGCCSGRSSTGAVGGAGVQSLLFGVYAGVILFEAQGTSRAIVENHRAVSICVSNQEFMTAGNIVDVSGGLNQTEVFPQIADSYRGSNF